MADHGTVASTLRARGQTATQANATAEMWGEATNNDWAAVTAWLNSTTVVVTPNAVTKVRPAGATSAGTRDRRH